MFPSLSEIAYLVQILNQWLLGAEALAQSDTNGGSSGNTEVWGEGFS